MFSRGKEKTHFTSLFSRSFVSSEIFFFFLWMGIMHTHQRYLTIFGEFLQGYCCCEPVFPRTGTMIEAAWACVLFRLRICFSYLVEYKKKIYSYAWTRLTTKQQSWLLSPYPLTHSGSLNLQIVNNVTMRFFVFHLTGKREMRCMFLFIILILFFLWEVRRFVAWQYNDDDEDHQIIIIRYCKNGYDYSAPVFRALEIVMMMSCRVFGGKVGALFGLYLHCIYLHHTRDKVFFGYLESGVEAS